jgi:16S rRNA (adenine(1408)-N(1))-methyltransferase
MERIRGKQSSASDAAALAAVASGYRAVLVDIGTGDGRYVRRAARRQPTWLAIGVDACRENLRAISRCAPPNALFVVANALALPGDLRGLATRLTINFPWGSLLTGLLRGDPALLGGLAALARPGAIVEIRVNRGALVGAGTPLEGGVTGIRRALSLSGFAVRTSSALDAGALHALPTTWAKRLAFGRDPSGWYLCATYRPARAERNGHVVGMGEERFRCPGVTDL